MWKWGGLIFHPAGPYLAPVVGIELHVVRVRLPHSAASCRDGTDSHPAVRSCRPRLDHVQPPKATLAARLFRWNPQRWKRQTKRKQQAKFKPKHVCTEYKVKNKVFFQGGGVHVSFGCVKNSVHFLREGKTFVFLSIFPLDRSSVCESTRLSKLTLYKEKLASLWKVLNETGYVGLTKFRDCRKKISSAVYSMEGLRAAAAASSGHNFTCRIRSQKSLRTSKFFCCRWTVSAAAANLQTWRQEGGGLKNNSKNVSWEFLGAQGCQGTQPKAPTHKHVPWLTHPNTHTHTFSSEVFCNLIQSSSLNMRFCKTDCVGDKHIYSFYKQWRWH